MTADDRDARLPSVHEHFGCWDLRGPHQVGGCRGGEDLEGGLVGEAGRRPKAADLPTAPIEAGGNQGGAVGAAA